MRQRKNMLSISQAAEVLGVSVSTLDRWEKEGRLAPRPLELHRRHPVNRQDSNHIPKG